MYLPVGTLASKVFRSPGIKKFPSFTNKSYKKTLPCSVYYLEFPEPLVKEGIRAKLT